MLLSLFAGICPAFDTGPHHDLTRTVLAEHGFNEDSIKAIQVENWLTDYYSNSPTYSEDRRRVLENFHFDNLYTDAQVDHYWAALIRNLKIETQKAARDDDVLSMLVVMGIGLHAVQDFYSHSNWVELHPRTDPDSYRTDTYIGYLASGHPNPLKELHTGKFPEDRTTGPGLFDPPEGADLHGGYETGINHDSQIRPRWAEAYVFAYCASQEMVTAFEQWANKARPGFWQKMQVFLAENGQGKKLDADVRASRNISMWLKAKGMDGTWKGNDSGSTRFFTAFSSKWVSSDSSVFVHAIRDGEIQKSLAADLYDDEKELPVPELAPYSLRRRTVEFRAVRFMEAQRSGLAGKMPRLGTPDFYARVTIGGQEYWTRTIQRARELVDPWTEIAFVGQDWKDVNITIKAFDEDSLDAKKDQRFDINPLPDEFDLNLTLNLASLALSGDVEGVFDTASRPFGVEGAKPDKPRAFLNAWITSRLLK